MKAALSYLLAGLLLIPPAASAAPMYRTVVVIGTEVDGNWGEASKCPDNSICLDGPYEARFETVRNLFGVSPPKEFNATLWMHVHPKRPLQRAFVLQHWPDGRWSVLASSRDPCFDKEKLKVADFAGRSSAGDAGDKICFNPPRAK